MGALSFMLNAVRASLIFEFVKLYGPTLCYCTVLKLCQNLVALDLAVALYNTAEVVSTCLFLRLYIITCTWYVIYADMFIHLLLLHHVQLSLLYVV